MKPIAGRPSSPLDSQLPEQQNASQEAPPPAATRTTGTSSPANLPHRPSAHERALRAALPSVSADQPGLHSPPRVDEQRLTQGSPASPAGSKRTALQANLPPTNARPTNVSPTATDNRPSSGSLQASRESALPETAPDVQQAPMDSGLDAAALDADQLLQSMELNLDQNERAIQAAMTEEPADEADSAATFKSTFQFTKSFIDTESLLSLTETGEFKSELSQIKKSHTLFAEALSFNCSEKHVSYVARKQSAVGFFSNAKNTLAMLSTLDEFARVKALMDIANAQYKAGSINDAKATLKEAFLFAMDPESTFTDPWDAWDEDQGYMETKISSIYQIAVLQSELGFTEDAAISMLNGNELRANEYNEDEYNEDSYSDHNRPDRDFLISHPVWYTKMALVHHNMGFMKTAEVYLNKAVYNAGNISDVMNHYEEDWWFCPSVLLTEVAQQQLHYGYRDSALSIFRAAEKVAVDPYLYYNDREMKSLDCFRVLAEKQANLGFRDDAIRNFQKAKAAVHPEQFAGWLGGDEAPSAQEKAAACIAIALSEDKSGFHDDAAATLNYAKQLVAGHKYLELFVRLYKNESRELVKRGLYEEAFFLENKLRITVGSSCNLFEFNILRARLENNDEIRKNIFLSAVAEVLNRDRAEVGAVNSNAHTFEIIDKVEKLKIIASAQAETFLPDDAHATINLMKDLAGRFTHGPSIDIDDCLAMAHADLAVSLVERFRK